MGFLFEVCLFFIWSMAKISDKQMLSFSTQRLTKTFNYRVFFIDILDGIILIRH